MSLLASTLPRRSVTAPVLRAATPRMLARRFRAPLAIAVFLGFACTSFVAGPREMLRVLSSDGFVLGAIAGLLAAQLGWERSEQARRIALWATVLGLVGWLVAAQAGAFTPRAGTILYVPGAVGLAMMLWRVATGRPRARRIWALRLRDALVIAAGVAVSPFMLMASAKLITVFDLHVLAFEDTLGPRFSRLSVAAFKALPWFGGTAITAYYLLPAGVAVAIAAFERRRPPLDALLAFAALTAVGYALYWVFPVAGPQQVFGPYPYAYPPAGSFEVRGMELALAAPRNGMPSLHTAWSLMLWFVAAAAGWKLRWALRIFAALNIAATMGAEDAHWITDLIVAVPMAVAVCAAAMLGTPMRGLRLAAIVVGAVTTAVAMALLLGAVPLFQAWPALSWLFVLATVVPPLAINARLWRAALATR